MEEYTDWLAFLAFCSRNFPEAIASELPKEQILKNLNCEREGFLNLTGLLLFGKNQDRFLPASFIHCVAYYGTDIGETEFIDKMEAKGTLLVQFEGAMAFLKRNLRRLPVVGLGFNQPGKLEIAENAIQEAIVNALLHRDYSYPASIRVLIFTDRVEITSPGRLPNHLEIEQIKTGIAFSRNQILARLGNLILPYEGLGSGIRRILIEHPETELISDEKHGDQFIVLFRRPDFRL